MLNQSGLYFSNDKRADLEKGVMQTMQSGPYNTSNINAYYATLEKSTTSKTKEEMTRLINNLTNGETHFFRDEAQFEAVTEILSKLIAEKRMRAINSPQLRIWSAGCSTGEEAYTVAILVSEMIPDITKWQISILGTDINNNSLAQAKKAIYGEWSFRGEHARRMQKTHFTKTGKSYHLRPSIQNMVTFAYHNLLDDFPSFSHNIMLMDIILCRNVIMYFAEKTMREIINKFYDTLVIGGWLAVGHVESWLHHPYFQSHNFPNAIIYRKPKSKQISFTLSSTDTSTNKIPDTNTGIASSQTKLSLPHEEQSAKKEISIQRNAQPDSYRVVQHLLGKGDITEADRLFNQNLQKLSTDSRASLYFLLGKAYANIGSLKKARRYCRLAIQLNLLSPEVYYLLAMIHLSEGKTETAITNFKRTIYLNNDAPLAHFNLGLAYKSLNDMTSAQRSLNNAIKILRQWTPSKIVPDTGGATARNLLDTAQRLLKELG